MADIDAEALLDLRNDPRFGALDAVRPSLRLFSALGVSRDEVAHSQLIAALFDPRRHSNWNALLRAFLQAVATTTSQPRISSVLSGLSADWNAVTVHRERFHIDVLIDVRAAGGGAVIGIENKIDALERPNQMRDYQSALRTKFPGRSTLLLFLTPEGRPPSTADANDVPCGFVSYARLVAAIGTVRAQLPTCDPDSSVLDVVECHFREELMGEPSPSVALARELWIAHPKAIRLLLENRPRFENLITPYEAGIRAALGAVAFDYYPSRGDVREIKFQHPVWSDNRPITFILHEREGRVDARALIWCELLAQHRRSLTKWATEVNGIIPGLIDEQFRPVSGWNCWHRVFCEEDWPAEATIENGSSYTETVAQSAIQRTLNLVALLRPHIKASS